MRIGGLLWLAALAVFAGCVLGSPDDPGCTEDAECGEGFSCRGGACFRENHGGLPVPADAGADTDVLDGGGDADGGDRDAADAPVDAQDSG
jgi:hypothetical protein